MDFNYYNLSSLYLYELKSSSASWVQLPFSSSKIKGALILNEWENTGANEDAFLALVEKYSEDTYTNTTGGLYENLAATSLSGELSAWLLDESRKEGDIEAITSDSGYYYVMY